MEKIYPERSNYMDEDRDEFFILPQKIIQPLFQNKDFYFNYFYFTSINFSSDCNCPLIVKNLIKDKG